MNSADKLKIIPSSQILRNFDAIDPFIFEFFSMAQLRGLDTSQMRRDQLDKMSSKILAFTASQLFGCHDKLKHAEWKSCSLALLQEVLATYQDRMQPPALQLLKQVVREKGGP